MADKQEDDQKKHNEDEEHTEADAKKDDTQQEDDGNKKKKKSTKEQSKGDGKTEKQKEEEEEAASPRRSSRHNKIYRAPPTPEPTVLRERERTFILDNRAVSNISQIYSRANPKLGSVIPPYNAQKDRGAQAYFSNPEVSKILKKNGQEPPGTSIDGHVMDYFFDKGTGARYLSRRNINGCGRSKDEVSGHANFMEDVKPCVGYNGRFGYRRTTPNLRQMPSPFGVDQRSPLY